MGLPIWTKRAAGDYARFYAADNCGAILMQVARTGRDWSAMTDGRMIENPETGRHGFPTMRAAMEAATAAAQAADKVAGDSGYFVPEFDVTARGPQAAPGSPRGPFGRGCSVTAFELARRRGWHYSGDVSLSFGGLFFREGGDDWAEAVEVIDVNGATGGPGNHWHVVRGSIYLNPRTWDSALDCGGLDRIGPPTWAEIVEAFHGYAGIEPDGWNGETRVQIGARCADYSPGGWHVHPDVTLHGNAKLTHYIAREFLAA